jgi:hypothetical protein
MKAHGPHNWPNERYSLSLSLSLACTYFYEASFILRRSVTVTNAFRFIHRMRCMQTLAGQK